MNVVAGLVRTGSGTLAHSSHRTFALAWLRQHRGQLVGLSPLPGHERLDNGTGIDPEMHATIRMASPEPCGFRAICLAFGFDGVYSANRTMPAFVLQDPVEA